MHLASQPVWIPPQGYLQYIKSLPLNDSPELFGLHDNANITFAQNETFALLGAIMQLQPKTFTLGGRSREEVCAPLQPARVQAASTNTSSQGMPSCLLGGSNGIAIQALALPIIGSHGQEDTHPLTAFLPARGGDLREHPGKAAGPHEPAGGDPQIPAAL